VGQPCVLSPVVWRIYVANTLWMLVESLGRVVKCSNRLLVTSHHRRRRRRLLRSDAWDRRIVCNSVLPTSFKRTIFKILVCRK
jgi:hypothetical protein